MELKRKKCSICHRQELDHKANSKNCPIGRKTSIGYTSYHESNVFKNDGENIKKLSDEKKIARNETRIKNKELKKLKEETARIEGTQKQELEKLRQYPFTNAIFSFKVGDKVKPRTANWNFMDILEVLDNGTILKVLINSTRNHYGKLSEETEVRYISHLEALPFDLEESSNFSFSDKKQISFHNTMIQSLFSKHYYFKIDYSPVYQRELCWSLEDKENLIKSIFNNVEIGKFAFIRRKYAPNSPGYEILDGKQRLSTIIEFYEDKFSYKGKKFSDLSRKDKNHFLNYNITYGDGDESWSIEDKMEYFLKLNIMGVPQSKDHLEQVALKLKELKKEE